jgi:hypothetical protein
MLKARWNRLSAPERVASVASVAAAAVWIAVGLSPARAPLDQVAQAPSMAAPSPEPSAAPSETTGPAAAQPATAQPPTARVAPAAPRSHEVAAPTTAAPPDALAALRQGLASQNAGTRIEALRTLTAEQNVSALPELLARDLAQDADIAPTLVSVTAQLAQRAPAEARAEAASQLKRWLHSELSRQGNDARGNVSVLVEALGAVRDPAAAAGLIEVLQNDRLPLHVQTLAVQGLAHAQVPGAQEALTQFRARLAQTQSAGFEGELKREAEQLTDRALAQLTR